IGQFGVGFYSAFMVADWIRVTSRSYHPEANAAVWYSTGSDTFTVGPATKDDRGTEVTLRLKDEFSEFCKESRLQQIIKRHSDFVPFPVYLGENKQQANQQTALWRQQPRQVQEDQYKDYYRQLTLEFEPPLTWLHLSVDAPVQVYALLYVPTSPEPGILSTRKSDGLRLYARKILIQEYCKDILPEYLRFMAGVVDSEDLPLNVSRETVQSTRTMGQLKKLLTSKLLDHFGALAKDQSDAYTKFWSVYGRFLKEGIATPNENTEPILPLLRFHSLKHPQEWISFDQYLEELTSGQESIYYLLGDNETAALRSPHLEAFRARGIDVLILADPIDSFALLNLTQYKDHKLANAASADLPAAGEEGAQAAQSETPQSAPQSEAILQRFKAVLGDRISEARLSNRLVESPVRLAQPKEAPSAELQRVYRLLQKDLDTPQPVLEINPTHPIIQALATLDEGDASATILIEQIFTNAQIMEGLPVDPTQMVDRIQQIIIKALE
ncbi:molecular chaperone HtpG, partial [bacterium]